MMDSEKSPDGFVRSAPRAMSVYLGAAMTLQGVAPGDVERMLRGIRKYQEHPFARPETSLDQVWQENGVRLYFCPGPGKGAGRKPLLLVPSMINGSEILDLLPRRSFMRWIAEQGFDVYLMDWGDPANDSGLQSMGGVSERIIAAASFVHDRYKTPVNALGYCMGGTLLLGAAVRDPALFGALILLSAPWDFHAGDPRMKAQVMMGMPSALQLLETKPALPVDWIQNVFAHVNPRNALDKFSKFLDMEPDSADEKIFIAVEDWLNGGGDLSAGVARTCILDWYGKNDPARGDWVDLSVLGHHPVLVVAAGRDILVPPESATAVMQKLPRAALITPQCGHISLMAGKSAKTNVWEPVCAWLKALE